MTGRCPVEVFCRVFAQLFGEGKNLLCRLSLDRKDNLWALYLEGTFLKVLGIQASDGQNPLEEEHAKNMWMLLDEC